MATKLDGGRTATVEIFPDGIDREDGVRTGIRDIRHVLQHEGAVHVSVANCASVRADEGQQVRRDQRETVRREVVEAVLGARVGVVQLCSQASTSIDVTVPSAARCMSREERAPAPWSPSRSPHVTTSPRIETAAMPGPDRERLRKSRRTDLRQQAGEVLADVERAARRHGERERACEVLGQRRCAAGRRWLRPVRRGHRRGRERRERHPRRRPRSSQVC